MTDQNSLPYVWGVFGLLAVGLASVLITVWLLVKELGAYLHSDSDQSEGYVVRSSTGSVRTVRAVVGLLAIVLGVFGLWIFAAELTRPRLSYFPSNPEEASAIYALRGSAIKAAQVGMVRGDLWVDAAIATAAPLLFGAGSSRDKASQPDLESMRMIADRAARLSPHDSRVWLVLAGLEFGEGHDRRGAEALKLSYYTGPDELLLMPARLRLAVGSDASSNEEVQILVPQDIRRIVRRLDLKPSIALAYQQALPKGRAIIEAALKEADPNLLATIAGPGALGR
jgi:hypothetical protein